MGKLIILLGLHFILPVSFIRPRLDSDCTLYTLEKRTLDPGREVCLPEPILRIDEVPVKLSVEFPQETELILKVSGA